MTIVILVQMLPINYGVKFSPLCIIDS